MKAFVFFLLIATLVTAPIARAADITGVITLKGTPPAEIEITPLEDDPTCGPLQKEKPTTHFYVVGPNGGLADVIVSLKGVTGQSIGASATPVVLDQKGCQYVPQILAAQTGQKIVVKNSDPCIHNVHTTPTVAGNPESNQVQMPGGADLTFTFTQPEMFLRFKCDVHPWMFAWVSVFDSPYFCVSDKDGKFVIKNVPPGKYTVEAEHRKLSAVISDTGEFVAYKGIEKEVEVADKDVNVNFTFEVK
jgi:plastocyanin